MLHLVSPPLVSGLFRSEIYFENNYYDTQWSQHITSSRGIKFCEVLIHECRNCASGVTDVMVMVSADFEVKLIIRAKQIKEAKNCQ